MEDISNLESKMGEYGGELKTLYKIQCILCSKDYWRPKKELKNSKYCSRSCQSKSTIVHKTNCLSCNLELIGKGRIYCSNDCQWSFLYEENVRKWKAGEIEGINAAEGLRPWLRRYLMERADNKCSECGWSKVNPTTGKIPLQIDHIDGDYKNNKEENLRVLCPCCHALTPTYGNLNMGKGREKRRKRLQDSNSVNKVI